MDEALRFGVLFAVGCGFGWVIAELVVRPLMRKTRPKLTGVTFGAEHGHVEGMRFSKEAVRNLLRDFNPEIVVWDMEGGSVAHRLGQKEPAFRSRREAERMLKEFLERETK